MPYPVSLPSYVLPDPAKTLDQDNHTQRHTDEEADIVALATKVGIDGSAVTSTIDYKLATVIGGLATHIANTSNPHSTTKAQVGLSNADNTSDATKQLAFLQVVYPIGSQYVNFTDATNPATLFGFGTWVAVTGRVIVGKAASGTFGTAGVTGGAETNTHYHWQTVGSDPTNFFAEVNGSGSGHTSVISVDRVTNGIGGRATNNSRRDGTYDTTIDILQPYVVAYVWQRTA